MEPHQSQSKTNSSIAQTPAEQSFQEQATEDQFFNLPGLGTAFADGRLQRAQRQDYVQRLGQQHGNQALQRVLESRGLIQRRRGHSNHPTTAGHPSNQSNQPSLSYNPGEREASLSGPGRVDGTRQSGMQALLYNFSAGQATPKPEHTHLVQEMTHIHRLNQANPGADLFITGYSDGVADERHNSPLREERAHQIAQQFQQQGVQPSVIRDTQGAAPNTYLATNNSREGRAKNRGTIVDVMQRNQPQPHNQAQNNTHPADLDNAPAVTGDNGLDTSHASFRSSSAVRARARQDFVLAEPNRDYEYLTLKEIRFRTEVDGVWGRTNAQSGTTNHGHNQPPRSTSTPLGELSTNLYHQGDTTDVSDNTIVGGRGTNVTSREGFNRRSSREAGGTFDVQRSHLIGHIMDRPVRFTFGGTGQANSRNVGGEARDVGALGFVVGIDFNGIGGQATVNLAELTEAGNVEFFNMDFALGPVNVRLQQSHEGGSRTSETLGGSIIFKCALRKDQVIRQMVDRFGPRVANWLRNRGVNVAERAAAQAGEQAAIRGGERAAVQAGERGLLEAGERGALQAGERAAVQTGERAAAQAGERIAIRVGGTLLRGAVNFLGVLGMLDLPITKGYWMLSGIAGAFQEDDQFYNVIRRIQRKTFNFCIAFAQVVRGEGSQVGNYGEGTDQGFRIGEQFLARIERENGQEGVQQVMRDFQQQPVRMLYGNVLNHYLNHFTEQAWETIPESTRTPAHRNVLETYLQDLQPGGNVFNRLVAQNGGSGH